MSETSAQVKDRTFSAVYWRMANSARALIEESKGYTTGRDEVTIDTIVRSVAYELLQLGLIEPDVKEN